MKLSPPSASQGGPLGPRHLPHFRLLLVIPPTPFVCSFSRDHLVQVSYIADWATRTRMRHSWPQVTQSVRNRTGTRPGPLTLAPPHPSFALSLSGSQTLLSRDQDAWPAHSHRYPYLSSCTPTLDNEVIIIMAAPRFALAKLYAWQTQSQILPPA